MGRTHAAALIRDAREDVQLTQAALASAAGIHQPTLAANESGKRQQAAETLRRILLAARTRTSIPLAIFAAEIRDSAQAHGLDDVRVFGSTLTGSDTEHSDIDLLVRTRPGTSIFDLGAFALDVEDLTGFRVDVITETQAANEDFMHVLAEAVQVRPLTTACGRARRESGQPGVSLDRFPAVRHELKRILANLERITARGERAFLDPITKSTTSLARNSSSTLTTSFVIVCQLPFARVSRRFPGDR